MLIRFLIKNKKPFEQFWGKTRHQILHSKWYKLRWPIFDFLLFFEKLTKFFTVQSYHVTNKSTQKYTGNLMKK